MRKGFIDRDHPQLSVRRQAALVSVNRRRLERSPRALSPETLELQRRIDELHLMHPVYGSRRIAAILQREGWPASRGRVRRAMRRMGIRATYRRPRTSKKAPENPVYPYLLRDLTIERPNQVWCSDISVPQQAAREMRDRPLAIGLQEQVANHRKRLGSKALVVSVAEKVPVGIR